MDDKGGGREWKGWEGGGAGKEVKEVLRSKAWRKMRKNDIGVGKFERSQRRGKDDAEG